MTIELALRRAPNVFVDNDLLYLRAGPDVGKQPISAAAWIAKGETVAIAHRCALAHAVALIRTNLSDHRLCLLAAHTAWQPNTRVARHRRIWGSLASRGLTVPPGREHGEGLVETEEGLRFFGARELEWNSVATAAAVLESEQASLLIAMKSQLGPLASGAVGRGWTRPGHGPDLKLLHAVCEADGVLLWLLGEFDDREAGCVALAKTDLLERLVT